MSETLEQMRDRWREEANGVTAMGYSQQGDRIRDCAAELDAYLTREQENQPHAYSFGCACDVCNAQHRTHP